ncbi:AraC family transcriptional regulator [Mucilaginibacter sp. CAU 1740]|uniref:AraC family transcriptional regulator n=1 Tax=Mucilaginibacter sp. CAU 1740 TaxID=3140365 RepID=UPI00325B5B2B
MITALQQKERTFFTRNSFPVSGIRDGMPWQLERFDGRRVGPDNYGKSDHFILCWSTRGCGKMRLRMMDRDLPKGRLFFLRPGMMQAFKVLPPAGWLVRFRPAYLLKPVAEKMRLHFLAQRPFVDLSDVQLAALEVLALQLEERQRLPPEPDLSRLYLTLLTELTATYYRQANGIKPVHPHERVVIKLLELIDRHFREQLTTDFYAGRLGIVPRKLNEISLMGTGFLVAELVEDRRLAEAELLLSTTKLLMKEIAVRLGFINGSHFNFWFLQRRGVYPKAYRMLALEDCTYR